jgi:hypothetical protein
MTLDNTAAAYGLVQVVFAHVTDQLAYAVFTLKQKSDSSASFEKVFKCPFGRLLSTFEDELRQFSDVSSLDMTLTDLRNACQELKALSRWRNERVHARVRHVAEGLALFNAETGQRLSISYVECHEIVQRLVKALVTLQTEIPRLVSSLDFDKEFDAFWKEHIDIESTD